MLTITTTHEPATDIGYLLHKHPDKIQTFEVPYGTAHVFYPEASPNRCTAALLVEIEPMKLTRRGNRHTPEQFLQDYINDRPYTTTSHFSVAIAEVFGTAMNGRCKDRPELAKTPIPLEATITSVRSRRGPELIKRLFEPLGYEVECDTPLMDPAFPSLEESYHHNVTIRATKTVQQLLNHLYVLLPVLDNQKHYWIGRDEVDKLVKIGKEWLPDHPEKEIISRRFLGHRTGLHTQATEQIKSILNERETDDQPEQEDTPDEPQTSQVANEDDLEKPLRLNSLRIEAVMEAVKQSNATSVLDLGCGEGRLMQELMGKTALTNITGMDVSPISLERAKRKLRINKMEPDQKSRLNIIHGSLMYRDSRLEGFDTAIAMEVIEHIDPTKLDAFQEVVFGSARPRTVVITTPNVEFNVLFEDKTRKFRHRDHRFEWTRQEFQDWCDQAAKQHNYTVEFKGIGQPDDTHGTPTQMAIFARNE